jgi:hypothetical protein
MHWLSRILACCTEQVVSSWQMPNNPVMKRDRRSLQMLKKINIRGILRKGEMIIIELIEFRIAVYFV